MSKRRNPAEEDEDDEITNETRAEWALGALREHYRVREGRVSGEEVLEDLESIATDCITDIFHLLSQNGIKPKKIVDMATMHFNDET